MTNQNYPDNVLYESDNLDVLRGMNSATVDLIATDPPFNTKRNRASTAGMYEDAWRWTDHPTMQGKRPDQWKWQPVHRAWLDEIKDDNPALYQVIEAVRLAVDDDTAAFLCFLSVRLLEMHRVLKPTGSLYLQCNHEANSYIRMCLDAIFGAGDNNFRNEIAWCYTGPGTSKARQFNRKHDTILWYNKSKGWIFNRDDVRVPYKRLNTNTKGSPIIQDTLTVEKRDAYLEKGKVPETWWSDFSPVGRLANERTGSPDQKPLKLYERIIRASSNEGDLVLDPFAGCATTPIAARNLGRRWIGIDRRKDAREHVVFRMMGIKKDDADKIRQQPHLSTWLDEQLAKYDAHYLTEPPVRTDEGETAAPELVHVYTVNERSSMTHAEMKAALVEQFGARCWGCGFVPPDNRYLELDHITPKSDGGSNHLDNRSLLCRPCNGLKGNRMTLTALRRRNKKDDYMRGEVPDLKVSGPWARERMTT